MRRISGRREIILSVRLDNRDNPQVPPGKPQKELDFTYFGGLYRNVRLEVMDRLHIVDPILEDKVAGGGVFVTFPDVSQRIRDGADSHRRSQRASGAEGLPGRPGAFRSRRACRGEGIGDDATLAAGDEMRSSTRSLTSPIRGFGIRIIRICTTLRTIVYGERPAGG